MYLENLIINTNYPPSHPLHLSNLSIFKSLGYVRVFYIFTYIVFHIQKFVSVVYSVYVIVKFNVFTTNEFNAVYFTFMLS